jgi:hypothetical protein
MGMMEIRCALPDGDLSPEEVGDDQTQSREPPPFGSQDALRACLIFLLHTTLANRRIPSITVALRITRLRQDAPCGSTGRISLRRRLRPDKMATGDRGVARRAKTGLPAGLMAGLPRHSVAMADGFGGVPLGFATSDR